jgi:hypothetical protein
VGSTIFCLFVKITIILASFLHTTLNQIGSAKSESQGRYSRLLAHSSAFVLFPVIPARRITQHTVWCWQCTSCREQHLLLGLKDAIHQFPQFPHAQLRIKLCSAAPHTHSDPASSQHMSTTVTVFEKFGSNVPRHEETDYPSEPSVYRVSL